MKLQKQMLRLYAITDRRWLGDRTLYEQVEEALRGGATMVQIREKELDEQAFSKEAEEILALCHRYEVPLIINDNVAIAKQIGADGVHIGQSDMELANAREILGADAIIGVTAKTVAQAQTAQAGGADYLGSGAVFGTSTKADAKPMELSLLTEITESVEIPVVAIGGITKENAGRLEGTGIAGLAVVSGIFAEADIETVSRQLRKIAEQFVR